MGRAIHLLTDKQLEKYKLPEGKSEVDLRDGGNLVLRVRPTSKMWRFTFTLSGEKDLIYIGEYPSISLAQAREQARQFRDELNRKENPRALREAIAAVAHAKALAEEHGAPPVTLGELFERWHRDYLANEHSDGGSYIKGIFDNHVLPHGMSDLRLDLMRVAHVKTILQRIQNKGLPAIGARVLSGLRQMVSWAHGFEWMDRDPTLGITKRTFGAGTQEGDRALSETELTQLHWRLKKSYLKNRWKHACWLIAATSTRVEETMLAERSHVDLARGIWTIPPSNQKLTNTGKPQKPHVIHLSRFARQHMEALMAMPGAGKFIFPARGKNEAPANEKTLTHALGNCQGKDHKGRRSTTELLLEQGPFGSHDLRRTSSTLMRKLGVDADVIDRCQNHVEPDRIRRTYQTDELRELMVAAWDKLGARLEHLTSLPDPEPDFLAPAPKYRVTDTTDPIAVAKRVAEDAVKQARRKQRRPRGDSAHPAVVHPTPTTIDYGDDELI